MLQGVGESGGLDAQAQLERARLLRSLGQPMAGQVGDPMADLAGASFRVRLLEALSRRSPASAPAANG